MNRQREPASPYNPLETLLPRKSQPEPRAAVRAEAPPAASEQDPHASPGAVSASRPSRMPCIRVGLRAERKLDFERFCHELGGQLGASLPPSQLLRVCCGLMLAHREAFLAEARAVGPLSRPPNDDHAAMRRFERVLVEMVLRGLRSPLRLPGRSCDTGL